jgi:hypothetical protein
MIPQDVKDEAEKRFPKQISYVPGGSDRQQSLLKSAFIAGAMYAASQIEELKKELEGYEEATKDKNRLVRELDIIINGEEGAAKQASLCDIVSQLRNEYKKQ